MIHVMIEDSKDGYKFVEKAVEIYWLSYLMRLWKIP